MVCFPEGDSVRWGRMGRGASSALGKLLRTASGRDYEAARRVHRPWQPQVGGAGGEPDAPRRQSTDWIA